MKPETIYASTRNDRQWKLIDGQMMTRLPGGIWRKSGWPEPAMEPSDIDYYVGVGQMFEVNQ